MRDVLAPESARWQALVVTFAELARRAGFGFVLTPLIALFLAWGLWVGVREGLVRGREPYRFLLAFSALIALTLPADDARPKVLPFASTDWRIRPIGWLFLTGSMVITT